tara:strand:- start:831 stop:1484 length:654 start_codon:yes stop_codon:yes gene_type:complete
MDRRKKLTPARKKLIVACLKKNLTVILTCRKAGIQTKTFYRWLRLGRNGDKEYEKFFHDVEAATAAGAEMAMDTIIESYGKDWKSAAWVLERKHGYRKEGKTINEELTETETKNSNDDSPKEILWNLCRELKASIEKAKDSGSWQAYAALQRTYLTTYREYREISASQSEYEELETMKDEELINQIKNVYLSLNPKLQTDIIDQIGAINKSVLPLKK